MGPKPSKDQKTEVILPNGPTKTEEDSGWSLVEINLDSNGDGIGMTVGSVLFISVVTLALFFLIKRLKSCYTNYRRRRIEKKARQNRLELMVAGRPPAQPPMFDNDRFEEIVEVDVNQAPQPIRPEVPRPHAGRVAAPH